MLQCLLLHHRPEEAEKHTLPGLNLSLLHRQLVKYVFRQIHLAGLLQKYFQHFASVRTCFFWFVLKYANSGLNYLMKAVSAMFLKFRGQSIRFGCTLVFSLFLDEVAPEQLHQYY